jgi:DNA repair photolyase
MVVKEVQAKAILSASKIYPFVINPYVGCQHACSYCYARFMKRFTGHKEPWGEFVDVKINAPDLLRKETQKKKPAPVWISGVCDPYQPLESKYRLTRKCLEILGERGWPVVIQTRSPLVLRDMDILENIRDLEVGLSIPTADDAIRKKFEPDAPPIGKRVHALEILHSTGIRTYAMIAPMLPGAGDLAELLSGRADYLLVDRMNYNHAHWVYRKYNLDEALSPEFFNRTARDLAARCRVSGIDCRLVF